LEQYKKPALRMKPVSVSPVPASTKKYEQDPGKYLEKAFPGLYDWQ
jgi:hypothetical protein